MHSLIICIMTSEVTSYMCTQFYNLLCTYVLQIFFFTEHTPLDPTDITLHRLQDAGKIYESSHCHSLTTATEHKVPILNVREASIEKTVGKTLSKQSHKPNHEEIQNVGRCGGPGLKAITL